MRKENFLSKFLKRKQNKEKQTFLPPVYFYFYFLYQTSEKEVFIIVTGLFHFASSSCIFRSAEQSKGGDVAYQARSPRPPNYS
jgi:hypothetical protein